MRQQTLRDKLLGYAAPQAPVPDPVPAAMDFETGWSQIRLLDEVFKVQVKIADFKDLTIFYDGDIKAWRREGKRAFTYQVQCKGKTIYGEMVATPERMLGPRGMLCVLSDLCMKAPVGESAYDQVTEPEPIKKKYTNRAIAIWQWWQMIGVSPWPITKEISDLRRELELKGIS